MAVDVETDRTFNAGKPKALFQYANIGELDIHPDGKRFLIIKEAEAVGDSSASQIPGKINIVTNWFEELKDRVPIN